MKKENNKITYRGYIVLNDRKEKTNFADVTGYCNYQTLLKSMLNVLSSFGIKRTKDFDKVIFKNNIFIQPYDSKYHIRIEKIIEK